MARKRRPHAPDAKSRRPRYKPVVVADLTALDIETDVFMGPGLNRAKATRQNHDYTWKYFERHCKESGEARRLTTPIDPLDAPWWVFEDLVLKRRKDGKPLSAGYLANIASAVKWRYANREDDGPRVAAHQRPEHAREWTDLLKGARRRDARRAEDGEPPQEKVKPLYREQLVQLLQAEPPRTPRRDAFRAMVLLAFDTDLSAARLQALLPSDIDLLGSPDPNLPGGIRAAGMPLPCDHTDRIRGVPHDCTACAVRAVLASHPGSGPLLVDGPSGVASALSKRRRQWPWLQTTVAQRGRSAVTPVRGLDAWQLAGLRRGLVLAAGYEKHQGFMWVRARAWTATAWVAGFRMVSDLARLDRSRVEPDASGRGYLIRLLGTKDDAPGTKEVVRSLEWSASGGPSAAEAMAEYLAVRDAAVGGREGALLVASAHERHGPLAGTVRQAADDLALLCEFAGVPAIYSSYSTRKGYAEQARRDGWSPVAIQEGLRHQVLDTTRLYTGASDEHAAVSKLMGPAPKEKMA